ncbi:hypothetical protein [Magnetococcus marinus]|uniref:hypothetical protein n=1 Tax=Magnetococcus marinus TaxID=1124597 RepID=UPI0003089992|nr:hypothetical protein [Magnetococcus marinus]
MDLKQNTRSMQGAECAPAHAHGKGFSDNHASSNYDKPLKVLSMDTVLTEAEIERLIKILAPTLP